MLAGLHREMRIHCELRCSLGRHCSFLVCLFCFVLWKLLRTMSLGTHTELQRRGWTKGGRGELSTFSVCFSHNLCEDPDAGESSTKLHSREPGQAGAHKPAMSPGGTVVPATAGSMVCAAGEHAVGLPVCSPAAFPPWRQSASPRRWGS